MLLESKSRRRSRLSLLQRLKLSLLKRQHPRKRRNKLGRIYYLLPHLIYSTSRL
jgi:hypothetical protein